MLGKNVECTREKNRHDRPKEEKRMVPFLLRQENCNAHVQEDEGLSQTGGDLEEAVARFPSMVREVFVRVPFHDYTAEKNGDDAGKLQPFREHVCNVGHTDNQSRLKHAV